VCFLLFSNYENQPCVQGDAFACGLPFIGTDVGGIGEFLPETFGILIPKGDEDALYRAMESVIRGRKFESPAEMHRFAEENFSPEHLANRFHDIYNRVMHEK
ncbi:MAG TPA: glycosyltransferase, partial [Saprospiraceae bacterium]|nr:glycosyltransferase [Saprospiraceae bacterium]